MRTWTVVTGAASSTGRRRSAELAARGKDLVLIDEDRAALEALATELRVGHRVDVRVLTCRAGEHELAARWLLDRELVVDGIVLCRVTPGDDRLVAAMLPQMRRYGFAAVVRAEDDEARESQVPRAPSEPPRPRRSTEPGYGDPS